jgi:aryl-alcohol dehydrogenase-like predicted oxidoreductase
VTSSNYTAERLRQALDTGAARALVSYSVFQPHYNLVERQQFEGPLQDLCVQRGLASVPYFALASGFLTGKYRSRRDASKGARGSAAAKYADGYGLGVLRALDDMAKASHATPAQVALAWLAAQPTVAAPIASATSVAQVEELVGAMRLTLTAEQLLTLNRASDQRTATGA